MRAIVILSLFFSTVALPQVQAATELNFWHSYLHAQTGVRHFSFNLANYKRGLFFGSCGPSTRSQRWAFTFDLAGEGPVYSAEQVTLSTDEPKSVKVTGGTITIDAAHRKAVIALQVSDANGPRDFAGNGSHRIHEIK